MSTEEKRMMVIFNETGIEGDDPVGIWGQIWKDYIAARSFGPDTKEKTEQFFKKYPLLRNATRRKETDE